MSGTEEIGSELDEILANIVFILSDLQDERKATKEADQKRQEEHKEFDIPAFKFSSARYILPQDPRSLRSVKLKLLI